MQLDYGRQKDIEELFDDYQKEKSTFWRQRIEKTISDIMNESGISRQLRDEMIRSYRTGDKNHVKYCQLELRRLQAEKYNNNIQL